MVHTVQRALACGRVSLSASPVKMSGKTFRFIVHSKLMWVNLGGESARINQNTIPAELRHCERFLQVSCKLALYSL